MNNKPVAWMLNVIVHEFDPSDWSKERYPDQAVIPLYTHPTKTLTTELQALLDSVNGDCYLGKEKEEVLVSQIKKQYSEPAKTLTDEVKDALMDALSGWKYIRHSHGDLYGVGWDRVEEKLEAILRKAQEK
jgi:hypothetical protein